MSVPLLFTYEAGNPLVIKVKNSVGDDFVMTASLIPISLADRGTVDPVTGQPQFDLQFSIALQVQKQLPILSDGGAA